MDYRLLADVISSASNLSKIKLIMPNISNISYKTKKQIYSWPTRSDFSKLSQKNLDYLTDLNIKPQKNFFNYYLIPHEIYEKNKSKLESIPHDEFEIIKDYFEVLKLKLMYQQKSEFEVEIKLANREPVEQELIPMNTSELNKLLVLKKHPDILITFENPLVEAKLPIFFAEFIFNNLDIFSSHKISGLTDRGGYSGRKSNKKHVQFRGVIEKKDTSYYQITSKLSLDNIKKLVHFRFVIFG